jgi:hypothetical protein
LNTHQVQSQTKDKDQNQRYNFVPKLNGKKEAIETIHLQIGTYVQFVPHNVGQIGNAQQLVNFKQGSDNGLQNGHRKPGLQEGANLDGLNEKDGQGGRPSYQSSIGCIIHNGANDGHEKGCKQFSNGGNGDNICHKGRRQNPYTRLSQSWTI